MLKEFNESKQNKENERTTEGLRRHWYRITEKASHSSKLGASKIKGEKVEPAAPKNNEEEKIESAAPKIVIKNDGNIVMNFFNEPIKSSTRQCRPQFDLAGMVA